MPRYATMFAALEAGLDHLSSQGIPESCASSITRHAQIPAGCYDEPPVCDVKETDFSVEFLKCNGDPMTPSTKIVTEVKVSNVYGGTVEGYVFLLWDDSHPFFKWTWHLEEPTI